jgi:transcriptional regulator with XRE-family HTH domain
MDEHFLFARRTLGERVRLQRKLLGISQEELAFRADIDRTYISQIERGVGNPSLQVLLRLAGVLQIKFAKLVEGI